jgi:hypothetical protein
LPTKKGEQQRVDVEEVRDVGHGHALGAFARARAHQQRRAVAQELDRRDGDRRRQEIGAQHRLGGDAIQLTGRQVPRRRWRRGATRASGGGAGSSHDAGVQRGPTE